MRPASRPRSVWATYLAGSPRRWHWISDTEGERHDFRRIRIDLATKAQSVPLPAGAELGPGDLHDIAGLQPEGTQDVGKVGGRGMAQLFAHFPEAELTDPIGARHISHGGCRDWITGCCLREQFLGLLKLHGILHFGDVRWLRLRRRECARRRSWVFAVCRCHGRWLRKILFIGILRRRRLFRIILRAVAVQRLARTGVFLTELEDWPLRAGFRMRRRWHLDLCFGRLFGLGRFRRRRRFGFLRWLGRRHQVHPDGLLLLRLRGRHRQCGQKKRGGEQMQDRGGRQGPPEYPALIPYPVRHRDRVCGMKYWRHQASMLPDVEITRCESKVGGCNTARRPIVWRLRPRRGPGQQRMQQVVISGG